MRAKLWWTVGRCTVGNFNLNNYKFNSLSACEPHLKLIREALRKFKGVP